jgi:hypothetical protein
MDCQFYTAQKFDKWTTTNFHPKDEIEKIDYQLKKMVKTNNQSNKHQELAMQNNHHQTKR